MFVCACAWVRWGGRPEDVRSCVHAWVGGCWKTEAQLCSLIFWERSGGVVDPPAPFSSAGSRRISAAASLHKVTLCNLPQAHKYNCNQERRGEREEEGQWTVKAPGEKGHWLFSACTSVAGRWHMTTYSRAPISFCTFFLHLHMFLYAKLHIINYICTHPACTSLLSKLKGTSECPYGKWQADKCLCQLWAKSFKKEILLIIPANILPAGGGITLTPQLHCQIRSLDQTFVWGLYIYAHPAPGESFMLVSMTTWVTTTQNIANLFNEAGNLDFLQPAFP